MLASMIAEKTSLSARIMGQPAVEVLRQRLDAITAAEFNLFYRAVEGLLDPDAGEAWLAYVVSEYGGG